MVLYGGGAKQVRTLSELGWFLTTGTLAQLFALVVVVVKLFMSPLQGKAAHPLADSPPCCLDGLTCSCRMLCSGAHACREPLLNAQPILMWDLVLPCGVHALMADRPVHLPGA